MTTTVIVKERYDQAHPTITIQEIRWLLRRCGRYSPMSTMILLAVTAGLRCDELLHLTLFNVSPDFQSFKYVVHKPKQTKDGQELVITRKHRLVTLDPWVAGELKAYCDLNFSIFETKEGLRYHSPYHDKTPNKFGQYQTQKLFPWKNTSIFEAYWYKLRKAMTKAGFDAERLDSLSMRPNGERPVYCVRFHSLRHVALSIYYYKHHMDLKKAQEWIKHSRSQTTDGYVHSAEALGVETSYLMNCSYAELFGFDDQQLSLSSATVHEQKSLYQF